MTGFVMPGGLIVYPRPIDTQRLAAAYRNVRRAEKARKAVAILPATSPEPCPRCGISGRKGCDHQAPYQSAASGSAWSHAPRHCRKETSND